MTTHRFDAVLGADAGVVLPSGVAAGMGGRARIPVAGTINGAAFRGSTMPMGARWPPPCGRRSTRCPTPPQGVRGCRGRLQAARETRVRRIAQAVEAARARIA